MTTYTIQEPVWKNKNCFIGSTIIGSIYYNCLEDKLVAVFYSGQQIRGFKKYDVYNGKLACEWVEKQAFKVLGAIENDQ